MKFLESLYLDGDIMQKELESSIRNIMGISIHAISMAKVIYFCEKAIKDNKSMSIGMVNVAKIINSRKDINLKKSLQKSDIIAADGQGIVFLSRLIGTPLPERVAGIDIMYKLMESANNHSYGIYFLGAKLEVVRKVVNKTKVIYKNIKISGCADGYFDLEAEGMEVAKNIKDSHADILFVAISPPKKEIFLDRYKDFMSIPVCHGVGGSFDVFAGITKRAPVWMQKAGLEWFYRVLQEPKRMWKRYFVTNLMFLYFSFIEIIKIRFKLSKRM